MVYIYLLTKEGSYTSKDSYVSATVKVSKELCKDCKTIEVVTHEITYDGKYNTELVWSLFVNFYDLFIYTGSKDKKNKHIYSFYWPSTNNDIIKRIEFYYSLLDTLKPFSIVFTTRGDPGTKFYYSYKSLVNTGYNFYRLKGTKFVDDLIEDKTLTDKLKEELKTAFKGVTFCGIYGSSSYIKRMPGDNETDPIGSKKQFKRFSLISSTNENVILYTDKLFQIPKEKIKIPESGLGDEGVQCDGILVYQNDNTPLLIQCIDECEIKNTFVRKDCNGFLWDKGTITYDNYEKLVKELERVKSDSEDKITFLLDKFGTYDSVLEFTDDERHTGDPMYKHTIYKHDPKNHAKSKARVFYNNELFDVLGEEHSTVQNKAYKLIETFSHFKIPNTHLLIKFTQDPSTETFYYRNSIENNDWKYKDIKTNDFNLNSTTILYDFYYKFKRSIKIQLFHIIDKDYDVELVDNSTSKKSSESSPPNNLKISVAQDKKCIDNKYKCRFHNLKHCSSQKTFSDVAGLRLYKDTNEIQLFNDNGVDRVYLHYLPGVTNEKKLYVYTDATDNRILLVFYNRKGYKAKTKNDNGKLFLDNTVRSCECTSKNRSVIIKKLDEIKRGLTEEPSKPTAARPDAGSGGRGSSIPGSYSYKGTSRNSSLPREGPSGKNGPPVSTSANPREQNNHNTLVPENNGKDRENKRNGDSNGITNGDSPGSGGNGLQGDTVNSSSDGFSFGNFLDIFKKLPELARKHPYAVYGGGSGVGSVVLAGIIGLCVLIYKKCRKGKPPPSIEHLL